MLIEAEHIETKYNGYSQFVDVTIKIRMSATQAHTFTEYPYIYLKEKDNDFVCPYCGGSLS